MSASSNTIRFPLTVSLTLKSGSDTVVALNAVCHNQAELHYYSRHLCKSVEHAASRVTAKGKTTGRIA